MIDDVRLFKAGLNEGNCVLLEDHIMADVQKVLEAVEVAKNTGKVKKGVNEATKALERGTAKLVAFASDVTPKEITVHLTVLAKEKGIPCFQVGTKEELGAAAGLAVPTSAVAIIAEGDAKKIVEELKNQG